MGYIKNYDTLSTNENRKIVLELIEAAISSIQPQEVFQKDFSLQGQTLTIKDKTFNLANFERVFLLGFGKGSALMCKILEEKLGGILKSGFVIDVVKQEFKNINYTLGTHPLPSQENFAFTSHVIEHFSELSEKDLVLITTCGGGSVMFEAPVALDLERMISVNKALLESGATITEMNVVRKHLSKVKGGGLAKILYPTTVVNMVFSDVPGNDLSVIASGPLLKDQTTMQDAVNVYEKYNLKDHASLLPSDFVETPKEDKYFEKVTNVLMLSNLTALDAMEKRAKELDCPSFIYTDRLQGDARTMGEKLIGEATPGHVLLAGGETTIKVTGSGKGGRSQALVLCSLPFIKNDVVIAAFGTDGWDFYEFAGALADRDTLKKIEKTALDVKPFLDNDNSYGFFEKVGDGILTGKLESNVSDLFIVYKNGKKIKVEARVMPAPVEPT